MTGNKILKIVVPILLALTALLGFFRRNDITSAFGSRTTIQHFTESNDNSLADYYNKAQQLAQDQIPTNQQITFLAVGDINLSRNVAVASGGDPLYPFAGMQTILHSVNFNFANLESPLSAKPIIGGHSLIFGAPTSSLKGLIDNNFLVLNLANNHAFDGGLEGLDFTKQQLDNNKLAHEGTGDTMDEAWKPAVLNESGIKICFVGASYASANDGGKTRNNYVARMEDLDRLKIAVATAKSECNFVVATMHGGIEYTRTPNDLQTTFAHAAIDDGADIVIGAHPHWVQTIEKYQGKYIFYSLGNFIFDQAFSQDTSEGLTLKITLSNNASTNAAAPNAASLDDLQGSKKPAQLESIELLPVIITNSQPRPATADESKKILDKIGVPSPLLK